MEIDLDNLGFTLVPQILDAHTCEELRQELGAVYGAGRRGLLAVQSIAALAKSNRLLDFIRPHLSIEPVPVRAIYFDKSPDANWFVTWHQDVTIALRAQADVPGFSPWSVKDGIPHVQPPVELLEHMLTIRLHLDDADESNGALRVIPGSHRLGRLNSKQIQDIHAKEPEHLCRAQAGDALLMRPLILHASSRATTPRHRRILHIEYAGYNLPPELAWHEDA